MNDIDLQSSLSAAHDWAALTAYDRTKRACAGLVSRGEKIPSWIALREIIGKGSSGDINRAVADYRRDQAEEMRRMSGVVTGLPESLHPLIKTFWQEAVAKARAAFAEQEIDWRAQLEDAETRAGEDRVAREVAERQLAEARAQLTGLIEANTALNQQLATEQSAREHAERIYREATASQAQHHSELRDALANSQAELDAAIGRLEGVENHALRQVEDARQEARKKVSDIERRAKDEVTHNTLETARMERRLQDAIASAKAANEAAVAAQHRADLAEQRASLLEERLSSIPQVTAEPAPVSLRKKIAEKRRR